MLRALAPLVVEIADRHRLLHTRGRDGNRLQRLPRLRLTQRAHSVERHLHRLDRAVVVELQLVDVCLAVGAVPAELQEGEIVVVAIVEHAAVTRAEHPALHTCRRYEVVRRNVVGAEGRCATHHVIVLIVLVAADGIEIVVDALPLEEDGTLAILLAARLQRLHLAQCHHVVGKLRHVAAAPEGIGLTVVVDEHLGVDASAVLRLQQRGSLSKGLHELILPFGQSERPVRTLGHTHVHIAVHGRVDIPTAVTLHRLARCPVFLLFSRREVGSLEAPVHEVLRLPHHRRPRRLQSATVAVGCGIAVERVANQQNAGIGNHIGHQRVAEGIARQIPSYLPPLRETKQPHQAPYQ